MARFSQACIAFGALALIYLYIWLHVQPVTNANGMYFNECCGLIRVETDKIITSAGAVEAQQAIMKFGLTVYPKQDPKIFSWDEHGQDQDTIAPLIFDNQIVPNYFVIADAKMRTYKFIRVRSFRQKA